jgi:ketosteroid isomerase-like protein
MSREHVDAVRTMYEALNRAGVSGARELLHPDAELHQPPEMPDADSYYGRDEFQRGIESWLSMWEEPLFEPIEITEAGDCVVMRVRVSGTGKASGVPATTEFFHVWTIRDGKPHRCFVRTTRAEALAAVGLERDAGL